jgi:voltage-gated potassium channel
MDACLSYLWQVLFLLILLRVFTKFMALLRFKDIIGLAGVPRTQGLQAWRVGIVFDWVLLAIAFWLPIQWYLQSKGHFAKTYVYVSDWVIWLSFIIETLVLTSLVKNKKTYLLGNWLNLVIIVLVNPIWFSYFWQVSAIRAVRLLVLIRVILPWAYNAHRTLTLNRISLTFAVFIVATCLSGVIISIFDPGIKNPFLGVWWAFETMTTVGYGDVVPVTMLGKMLSIVIMCFGMVLISVVTATISAYFVGKDHAEHLKKLLKQDSHKLEAIEKHLLGASVDSLILLPENLDGFIHRLSPESQRKLFLKLKMHLEGSL